MMMLISGDLAIKRCRNNHINYAWNKANEWLFSKVTVLYLIVTMIIEMGIVVIERYNSFVLLYRSETQPHKKITLSRLYY